MCRQCLLPQHIGPPPERLEILDWCHLIENLGKVGGSTRRLDAVDARLWQGDVDGAVRLFDDWPHERVERYRINKASWLSMWKLPLSRAIEMQSGYRNLWCILV
ncbi:hypothetical protein XM38_019500 [Halomicronema hongdechloris C2206]|uniref:Uncharacterized protein n=1 Tax=Halomicronema hongdechloris C2206 TaxID=1641165 RepID=A0A1Z3HL17_9CYAN|nr:hypothetical protein XM38_019500 [Halomicronema hongdechloris C2206]